MPDRPSPTNAKKPNRIELEIAVTPAMIDAGVTLLGLLERDVGSEYLVTRVYQAMETAGQLSSVALMAKHPPVDEFDEKQTIERREAALQRMLSTPHKPHKSVPANRTNLTKRPKRPEAKK